MIISSVPVSESPKIPRAPLESRDSFRFELFAGLIGTDVFAIAGAFFVVNALFGAVINPSRDLSICGAVIPLYAALAIRSSAYNSDISRCFGAGAGRAISALFLTSVVIMALQFYFGRADRSLIFLALSTILSAVFLGTARCAFARWETHWISEKPEKELIIVDEVPFAADAGAQVLDLRATNLRPTLHDPLMHDKLASYLEGINRVIVACPPERRRVWSLLLKGANVNGELITEHNDDLGVIGMGRAGDKFTVVVSCAPLNLLNRAMKRLFDLALTIPALILFAPLLVVTAIAIKLESPGPVFFCQQRLGRGNRLFSIVKFRSMRHNLCDLSGDCSTLRADDRITRVGRFIRRTSIDELPQLFNVLKGEMSLVGPRPHALGSKAGSKLFWEVDQRYWHRHVTKPGITGLAQVRGYRGATDCLTDLQQRLHADLEYISGWTIWRDIGIILRTIPVVVHRNAY